MRGSRGMRHLALIGGLVAAACCGVAATAMASDTYVAWKRQPGTANGDYATGVATDAAGNVYLTGTTGGWLGGANKGSSDAFVAKYAADGHLLWKRQLGSVSSEYVRGVATDAAGNVYLTGSTYGSLGGANMGKYDAFVAKYAADGHLLWTRQLGTVTVDFAYGVATDAAGNVYVTGWTYGSLGGAHMGMGNSTDAFLAKYAADGHLLWTQQLGTSVYDYAYGVATDAAGDVYLAGSTYGSLGGAYNRGAGDAFVAKYAADGHLLWTQQLGSPRDDYPEGVATDSAGNVYLAGWTPGSLGGANKGRVDAWVAKYAADGQLLWTQQLGSPRVDEAHGVATDAAGNVYLAGLTKGSIGYPNRGGADAWVMKLDTDGHRLWARQPGTADDDEALAVATDAAGNVYLTGWTDGSLGYTNRGKSDAWVMKISPTAESAEEPINGPAD